MAIKTAEELWQDYFMEQENNEFLSTLALVQWENTIERMERDADNRAFEEWEEEIAVPFIEAEEEAEAKDSARKAKHRKSRKAEQDEYHHHRKPYWKYRDWNNEFALNRKRERRNLKVNDLLSKYETEEKTMEDWAKKERDNETSYKEMYTNVFGEYMPSLSNLWQTISEDGSFSYSCPEDFGGNSLKLKKKTMKNLKNLKRQKICLKVLNILHLTAILMKKNMNITVKIKRKNPCMNKDSKQVSST